MTQETIRFDGSKWTPDGAHAVTPEFYTEGPYRGATSRVSLLVAAAACFLGAAFLIYSMLTWGL